jgi:hypothetical protein
MLKKKNENELKAITEEIVNETKKLPIEEYLGKKIRRKP